MPFVYADGRSDGNARYHPTRKKRDGRQLYLVVQEFSYWTGEVRSPAGIGVTVPAGFETDLASIPRLPFFPKPGGSLWDDAAIVHDRALVDAAGGSMTFADADAVFYYALRDRGCNVFTATVFWAAVRLGRVVRS